MVWGEALRSNFLDVDWEAKYTNGKIWLQEFFVLIFDRNPVLSSNVGQKCTPKKQGIAKKINSRQKCVNQMSRRVFVAVAAC